MKTIYLASTSANTMPEAQFWAQDPEKVVASLSASMGDKLGTRGLRALDEYVKRVEGEISAADLKNLDETRRILLAMGE